MHDFIRVPPDSTGKRVRNKKTLDVQLSNIDLDLLDGLFDNDELQSTSGGNGYFTGYSINGNTAITIYIIDYNGLFNINDTLTFNGDIIGVIESYNDIYTQAQTVVDRHNPDHALKIDENGSANFKFSSGSPNIDIFGNLKTSGFTLMKGYTFYYGRSVTNGVKTQFIDTLTGGGSIVEEPQHSIVKLVNDTASNSGAKMTSSLYIPYTPQVGNKILFSMASGDSGKDNVIRRWGLYDDEDGIYFQLNGTVLSVNLMSSITNTIEEVLQNNFNGDPVQNKIFDSFELDVSKFNLYWIAYQWLGVGIAELGVTKPNGESITLHTFQNPNKNILPYMKRGTLPVRVEQINTGVSASTSEIKISCIAVFRESEKLEFVGEIRKYINPVFNVDNTLRPLVTLKLSDIVNGELNRIILQPIEFQFYVEDDPIIIEYYLNSTLTGSNFNQYSLFTEIDVTASSMSGGLLLDTNIYGIGMNKIIAENTLEYAFSNAGSIENTITVAVKSLKAATTPKLHFIGKWKEIE